MVRDAQLHLFQAAKVPAGIRHILLPNEGRAEKKQMRPVRSARMSCGAVFSTLNFPKAKSFVDK